MKQPMNQQLTRTFATNEGPIVATFTPIPRDIINDATSTANLIAQLEAHPDALMAFTSVMSSCDNWSYNGATIDDGVGIPVGFTTLQSMMADIIGA